MGVYAQNYSEIYFQLCNAGNAVNRVIESSKDKDNIQTGANSLRELIVKLIEVVEFEADCEQVKQIKEFKNV